MGRVIALYVTATAILFVFAGLLLLRRKGRAVVDGCAIWVSHDTHCTALVYYRDGPQIIRFGAEVGVQPGGVAFLYVDLPYKLYADDGEVVPDDKSVLVKQRVARGLTQLGIAHEFTIIGNGS